MTDTMAVMQRAATTRRITVTLQSGDAMRLREISIAERRDPRDQAALLLERAIREYDAGQAEE